MQLKHENENQPKMMPETQPTQYDILATICADTVTVLYAFDHETNVKAPTKKKLKNGIVRN